MAVKESVPTSEELEPLISSKNSEINKNTNKTYQSASWYMTGIVMANIILGLGLLSYPKAYRDAGGVLPGFITQTLCLVPLMSGFYALGKSVELFEDATYNDVVRRHCGKVALAFCHVIMFIHNFGTCVTFLVVLSDQLDELLLYCFGKEFCNYWFLRRHFTMPCVAIVFILPCCFMKHLTGKALHFISILGVITTIYMVFLVIWKYFHLVENHEVVEKRDYSWLSIIDVIPVICFSFEAHVESVSLYCCLRKRSMFEFIKATCFGVGIALVVYTIVGVFGYLGTGSHISSDLILSYYPPDSILIVAIGLMAVKAITTYPVLLFCVRVVLDDLLVPHLDKIGVTERCLLVLETIIVFVSTVFIAIAVPTIGDVIMVLGGSAAILILILPGLSLVQMYINCVNKKMIGTGVLMVVFGVFIAVTMTIQSILTYINSTEVKQLVCSEF